MTPDRPAGGGSGTDARAAAAAVRDEGWAVLADLFTPAECHAIGAASDRRRYPDVPADLLAWAMDPRWAPVVTATLGPDVRLLREQLVTKNPHSAASVPWHQDEGYLSLRPAGFLTCFLALEDIDRANGCLWVLPGSHRRGVVDHVPDGYLHAIAEPVAEDAAVAVPLRAGSVLVCSSMTFHRSLGNDSDGYRRAWILQFCGADATDGDGEPLTNRPRVAVDGVWQDELRF